MNIEVRDSLNAVPYAVDGITITFGMDDNKITIDASAYQSDMQVMVDVYQDDSGTLTLEKGFFYVATVVIPPAKYDLIDTGEKDDKDNEKYTNVKRTLNGELVNVVIWPLAKSVDLLKNESKDTESKS